MSPKPTIIFIPYYPLQIRPTLFAIGLTRLLVRCLIRKKKQNQPNVQFKLYILFKCMNKHCNDTFVVHGVHYLHMYMMGANRTFK